MQRYGEEGVGECKDMVRKEWVSECSGGAIQPYGIGVCRQHTKAFFNP